MSTVVQTILPTPSSRLTGLPVYAFAWLDELKVAARAKGTKLIDLGMGNPDLPMANPIVEAIQRGVADPSNHGYPTFKGKDTFRHAVARWMERRYGAIMDPDTEVQPLLGSKEGLAHLTFAYIEPGDYTIVPSPYYPVHGRATMLAGGTPLFLPLTPDNNFLPDLNSIPDDVAAKAKLFFINYPNNPTAAIADVAFYEKLVSYCKQHNIIVVSDLAYGEICYDGYRPPSIFNVAGAKDIAVEFHSFSKSFNMAGCRIGFACGNAEVIKTLYSLKTNLDYGVPNALQEGAINALDNAEAYLPDIIATYKTRRDALAEGFASLGWPDWACQKPQATLYLWLPVPTGFTSNAWTEYLIDEAGVVVTPGSAFGDAGEGFFRMSLGLTTDSIKQAVERLAAKGIRYA
jgi:LL-diaminopimelate aminotransferase